MTVSYDNKKNTLNFAVNNPNRDVTDALVVEYSYDGTTWETAYEETARWKFDNTDYTLSVDAADFNDGTIHFRLHATTLIGGDTYSKAISFNLDTDIAAIMPDGTQIKQGKGYIEIISPRQQTITIHTLDGRLVEKVTVKGTARIALAPDTYLINQRKISIR
jgi:hypothetical protein